MKILSGNSNNTLAENISKELKLPLTNRKIQHFNDEEIFVEILENVRGEDVFLLQSTSNPANDHIMEMLIMIDALRRGSARRITAVMPYFGYARQDRKTGPRTPITAKLVANLLTAAGANRVLTFDLHAGQIQGFFDIPTDNLTVEPIFSKYIRKTHSLENSVIISPDVGGLPRARSLAKRLNLPIAVVDKRRDAPGVSHVMHVIGDVEGKDCLIYDDIVDSAGTMCNAAEALMDKGARSVRGFAAHGVLADPHSLERVENSKLQDLVISDTILATPEIKKSNKINILTIAPLLSQAMQRISLEKSVSTLFDE